MSLKTGAMSIGHQATGGAEICFVERDVFDLAKRFLERQVRCVDALWAAMQERDFERIRKTGHDLKGSGGAYGLDALSYLGTELENAASAQDGDLVELLLATLEQQLSAIELRVAAIGQQEIATQVSAVAGSTT